MQNDLKIRDVKAEDIPSLNRILQVWIRDSETRESLPAEIQSIIDGILASTKIASDFHYIVADIKESVVGVIGLRPVQDEDMRKLSLTDKPAELINAYVDEKLRAGKGIGKALLKGLEEKALKMGYKEILVNSGVRYKDTAWEFYTRMYGEPVGFIENKYGDGKQAPVWRKML